MGHVVDRPLPTPYWPFSGVWLALKSGRWAMPTIPSIRGAARKQCADLRAGVAMLLEAEDKHFAWMLGGPTPESGLRLPSDGVDAPSVLEIVRRMATALRVTYGVGSWMIVVDHEVVGLCGYKGPPDLDGVVEIGYGVASSRRKRGYATRAIMDLLKVAQQDRAIRGVVAETTTENMASERVLERNGIVREFKRIDPEDGEVVLWRRDLSDFREQR